MRKYIITIFNFNPKTKEVESEERYKTKPMDDEQLAKVLAKEIRGRKHFCYRVESL